MGKGCHPSTFITSPPENPMPPPLQAALTVGAWILVILLLTVGLWFLRRHQLVHTAVSTILLLVGVFLLLRLRDLVIMLILAGVLAFILDEAVARLSRWMPRNAAIAVVYLVFVGLIVLAGRLIIPPIIEQARSFIQDMPAHIEEVRQWAARWTFWYAQVPPEVQEKINQAGRPISEWFAASFGTVEHVIRGVAEWTVKGILILVMSIYLLMDKRLLVEGLTRLFPFDARPQVNETVREMALTFRSYLRGQAIVILFVAVAATTVLLIFRIPYALFIGVMAGVLEVIPYFGALAGAVPAVVLGFMKSPYIGAALILFFILINQIEGHVVIPLVMGHHLELRPLTILVALIAGEMLFGIVGMIIAVPLVSLVRVIIPPLRKYYQAYRLRERGAEGEKVEAVIF